MKPASLAIELSLIRSMAERLDLSKEPLALAQDLAALRRECFAMEHMLHVLNWREWHAPRKSPTSMLTLEDIGL